MQRATAKSDLSLVICYEGPRGSGKTLSVAVAAAEFMVRYDLPVWANFRISFDFQDNDGKIKSYSANPVNMNALYAMDSGIRGGLLCIDEPNLWWSNRRSMSVANRLSNSLATLIRKRQLTVLLPCQNHMWLDSQMRFQIDSLVTCYDLSYRYPHLKRGQLIQQRWKDISGLMTGRTYSESEREYIVTLWGTPFFDIFNSYQEYDVLKAAQPIKLKLGASIITRTDLENAVSSNDRDEIIMAAFEQLRQTGKKIFPADEVRDYLRSAGLPDLPDRTLGRLVMRCGAEKKQKQIDGIRQNYYEIP